MNALETKVLELIGENPDSPDVFVDTEAGMAPIRDSLNDAIQEIVMLTGFHKRQYFVPLREQIAFYRLIPSNGSIGWITDAWSVTQQRRLEQTDLLRLSVYDPRWMIYTGSAEAYFPVGRDVIGFYPKPSADGNVIELTIVEIPAAYESGEDRVKLRESFQYAAVHFAVAEYWATRGDSAEAQSHMVKYLDALGLSRDYLPLIGQPRFAQTQKAPWPQATS
jgi:hypothetical protein